MEVDEIQTGSKFARKSCNSNGNGGATVDFTAGVGGVGQLCGWPSSRIVRVSRASGGKDRHSKVLTSKGLRDRRVRLSVNTAIQFYDLQDRLGYDQPSKAVDWLLKVAANSISELPPISTPFPDTPNQLNDENNMSGGVGVTGLGLESPDVETLSKSACSSNSENSKGSGGGLSLSRSESRLKARERARERASKEKENDKESENMFVQKHHHQQSATFTELLSTGFNGTNNVVNQHSNNNNSPNWPAMAMDYFGGTGVLVPSTTTRPTHGFSGQIQLGNTMPQAIPIHGSSPFFTISGDTHNQELHSFSLIPEHYLQNNEYNLNFSISSTSSSGLAGFNRGTLQSNSSTPSLPPQIQRFSSSDNNGSSPSGFFLTPPPHAAVSVVGSHHQQHHFQPTGFDAGLQLFYGDGGRHGDQKGKGKG